jgi:tetratricopeptide (TPR) repeat protein
MESADPRHMTLNSATTCLALAALLASAPRLMHACVWSYGTSLRGEKLSIEGVVGDQIVAGLNRFEPRSFWESLHRKVQSRMGPRDHYMENDLAVTLLHLGRAKEALAILIRIEREHPGSYVTAANLGTAYELVSDDRAALHWIRQAIARNPEAHRGTEWLHVRVLEAKLALRGDPHWLESHSVLGIDFGTGAIPKLPSAFPAGNDGKALTAEKVKHALWYQLDERYQFVRPPDAVVGTLLFEWANLLVRTDALESAVAIYREAIRYRTPNVGLASRRLQRAEKALRDLSAGAR